MVPLLVSLVRLTLGGSGETGAVGGGGGKESAGVSTCSGGGTMHGSHGPPQSMSTSP